MVDFELHVQAPLEIGQGVAVQFRDSKVLKED